MRKVNWDDLRFVLAVAETGSVASAARSLGVNHATVLRRIASVEERAGRPIFERTPTGYRLPPDRMALVEAAREVSAAISGVEDILMERQEGRRAVRITSTDTLCATVLPPITARMSADGVVVDLRVSNLHLDLGRLHADIALRLTPALPPDLAGEQAGMLGMAVYRAPGGQADWLGLRGPLRRARLLMEALPAEARAASGGADSFVALTRMAAAGAGRALLPCILADEDPRLERQSAVLASIPIWVASHIELADSPRLTRLRRRIGQGLEERAAALSGTG